MRPQSNLARGIESVAVAFACLIASFLFVSVTYWAAPMALIAWFFAITASRLLRRVDSEFTPARRGDRIRLSDGSEFTVTDVTATVVTVPGPGPTMPAGASARVLPSTIIPSGIALAFFAALPFFLLITSWFITEARFKSLESLSPSPFAEEKAKGGSTPHRLPRPGEKGARFDSADVFSGETNGTAGPAATVERNLGAGHYIFSVGTRPWKSQSPRSDAGSIPATSTTRGGALVSTGKARPMEAAEEHPRKTEQTINRQLPVADGGLTASRGRRLSMSPKPAIPEGSR